MTTKVKSASLLDWDGNGTENALYSLYGSTWQMARQVCLRQGKDLCRLDQVCETRDDMQASASRNEKNTVKAL